MRQNQWMVAAAVAAGLGTAIPAVAQQAAQAADKGPTGEAYVRKIDGPEVQVKKGQTPQVVAFFPSQVSSGGFGRAAQPEGFEVTIVERPSEQQGQGGGGMGGMGGGQEREIVFADASAVAGVVRYDFKSGPYADQPHKLVLTARKVGGTPQPGGQAGPADQSLQLQQVGSGQDVYVFKVMPPPMTDEQKQQQQKELEARQKQAEQQHQAATRAATQPGGQPAPAMEQVEPKQEMTPAIITVYLAPPA